MERTPKRSSTDRSSRIWCLPPLILHPFADSTGPSRLVESSRASLMLQGLLPTGDLTNYELEQRVLDGRYCEMRMVFYVGRDVMRWIEQSLDYAQSQADLRTVNLKFQSLAALLVESPPQRVLTKLKNWGVADYKAIFMRAIGLNTLFADMPDRTQLSPEFIRNYHRYADHIYIAYQNSTTFDDLDAGSFDFELYASGEYARILEKEWERN